MVNTQQNIQYNHNVVLTVFNEKYEGLRMFGTAKFYTECKYYKLCEETFWGNGEVSPFGVTKTKGAIVVTVSVEPLNDNILFKIRDYMKKDNN